MFCDCDFRFLRFGLAVLAVLSMLLVGLSLPGAWPDAGEASLARGSQVDPNGFLLARGSQVDPNGFLLARGSQVDPNGLRRQMA